MSQTVVTINDGRKERTVIFADVNTDTVFDRLVARPVNADTVLEDFVTNQAATLRVGTPQSSWVESVGFDGGSDELVFNTEDGSEIRFNGTFAEFRQALLAPSIGKAYWQFKREADAGER